MQVGDLVTVSYNAIPENGVGFVSIVLEINKSDLHPNKLQLVKVLEHGREQWYPIGYCEVVSESR